MRQARLASERWAVGSLGTHRKPSILRLLEAEPWSETLKYGVRAGGGT